MDYTAANALIDLGLMGILLIVGLILRAKLKIFQKLLIPAPLIGGFIGLALGPSALNVLPFSSQFSKYPGILIILVFASMAIGDKSKKKDGESKNIGGMFVNITGMYMVQYGMGLLISVFILTKLFDVHPAFGLIYPVGFASGHGTAAAVGSTFADLGWAEATDLAMTSATVGLVGGIVFGMVLINWATRKGYSNFVDSPSSLPPEYLTGLVPLDRQQPSGKMTVSSICISQLGFHIALISIAAIAGYYSSKGFKLILPQVTVPPFAIALLASYGVNKILKMTKTDIYVDRKTISSLSSSFTDLLVLSGIASIKLAIVIEYAAPLAVLFTLGFLINLSWFAMIGSRMHGPFWFERSMIAFGQSTGVLATGILLLRVVDPNLESRALEQSGFSNLLNRPLITFMQAFSPVLCYTLGTSILNGTKLLGFASLGMAVVIVIVGFALGWIVPSSGFNKSNLKKSNASRKDA
jgi:ESS family glutamate:Na+ symporter